MIRRTAILLIEIAAFAFGGLLLLAALLVWRSAQGPINVDFLTPYVEDAAADGPYGMDFGGTEARWQGLDSPLLLIVKDVTVFEREGRGGARRAVVQFPEVRVGLSWRSLLQRQLVARDLVLVNPRLWARRKADGSFGFGFGGEAPMDEGQEAATGDALARLVELLANSPDEGGRSALTRIELTDGRVVVSDEKAQRVWRGEKVAATITRQITSVASVFELSLAVSSVGPLGLVRGSFTHSLADGTTDVQLVLDGIDTTKLADVFLERQDLPSIDVPLRGVVAARLAPDLGLVDATFDISAEAGAITAEELFLRPVDFDTLGIAGYFDVAAQRLDVRALTVQAGAFGAILSGSVTQEDDYWDVLASLAATDLPVDSLERYWPRNLERQVRNWVVAKTHGGTIGAFDAAGQMRIKSDGTWERELISLDGRFSAEGLNLTPLHGLPPVRGLKGTATFNGSRMDFTVPEGYSLDAQLSQGRVAITGLGTPVPEVDIEFVAAGSMATGLSYLNLPRLRLIDKLGFDPAGSDGRLAGRVRLRLPIRPDNRLDDISAIAAVNIRDGIFQLNENWRLTGMSATLSVDQSSVNLDGGAVLLDVPIDFSARRLLRSEEEFDTRVEFDATVDADRLENFGIPPIPSLFGPISISVAFREGGDRQIVDMQADLSEAGLAIPQIEWAKPVGEPALITSTTQLTGWIPQSVPAFTFEGAGLILNGAAAFEPNGDSGTTELASLDVERFQLRDNDLSGTVVRRESGEGWQADIGGRSLSLRPLVRRLVGGGPSAAQPPDDRQLTDQPVLVDARIDEVVLDDGRSLSNVHGNFAHDGTDWTAISLEGIADDRERASQSAITVRFARDPVADRNLWVSATDFGTVLNALNVTDQIYGGELALTARLDLQEEEASSPSEASRPAMLGDVVMTSYRVVRAPAMAQLLVALSLNSLQGELEAQGIEFNGLEANFIFDQGVLTISDGETGGSGLGLTLEGTLDTRQAEFDMFGTIVPLRGINRLLNQVPVLGELLGGKDEGLFAFTYKIKGPVSSPEASVNPLSVLAPGALRELFRITPAPATDGGPPGRESQGETD